MVNREAITAAISVSLYEKYGVQLFSPDAPTKMTTADNGSHHSANRSHAISALDL